MRVLKTVTATGACALAALVLPVAALAAGSISFASSAVPTPGVTLSGLDQTMSFTIPSTAADTRTGGAAVGWNVTITSTTFTTGSRSLSTSASSINAAPTWSCQSGCTVNPTNSVGYPITVPAGSTAPAAVKIFNAASGTGKGTWNFTPTVTVSVPATTYSGVYTSTITLAIVSGP